MTEVTKARATAAAVGCAIILTTGTGMTNVLNAMIPDIMVGLGNPPLTLFMLGPSVATIMAFLGSMVATKLIEKLTPKWSLLIGTICVTLMLTVFAVADHVWMWIAANAVNGIVMSFGAHAAASGVTAKFWGSRTQSVYGIVSGVYSLMCAAEVFLGAWLLSIADYRTAMWFLVVSCLVLGVGANLLLIGKIPGKPLHFKEDDVKVEETPVTQIGVDLSTALKSPCFYFFAAVVFIGAWAMSAIGSFSTVFFTTYGVDSATAASWFGIHTLVGAILMLFAGFLTNKFGARTTGVIVFGLFIIGIVSLFVWSSAGGFPLVFAGMALTSTILVVAILPSLFIPDLFGMKHYTSINAACMAAYFLGHTVVMVALSGLTEMMGINNAFLFTAFLGAIAIACMILAYATRPMKKLEKKDVGTALSES